MTETPPPLPRKVHHGWFAVHEEALRLIARSCEEPSQYRAAVLAYVTVCRKCNLRGTDSFEDRVLSMAIDMGFSYRETQKALRTIERLGLVSVERRKVPGTKAKLPSIYTLKRLEHDALTLEQDATSLEHGAPTLGAQSVHPKSPQLSQELPQEPTNNHPYTPSVKANVISPGEAALAAFRQERMKAGLALREKEK